MPVVISRQITVAVPSCMTRHCVTLAGALDGRVRGALEQVSFSHFPLCQRRLDRQTLGSRVQASLSGEREPSDERLPSRLDTLTRTLTLTLEPSLLLLTVLPSDVLHIV
jgi:hypothetical protein